MRKIMVVDDDKDFCVALRVSLQSMGYLVTTYSSAAYAINNVHNFDVIISDISMPNMNGIEFTNKLREKHSLPIILITGFSEMLDAKLACELGAVELLPKPFSRQEIENAINRCLLSKVGKVAQQSVVEPSYCGVHINDFIMGRRIKYNIFLCLADNKFIKFANQGEDISIVKIKSLKAKGLTYIYLTLEDYSKYVGFNCMHMTKGLSSEVNSEVKENLIDFASSILNESRLYSCINEDIYNESRLFVETTLNVILQDSDLVALLNFQKTNAEHILSRSLGTSLYGIMLAAAVNWHLPNNKFKIAAGGLFADVGLTKIDSQLLINSRRSWTELDVEKYETHPVLGAQLLLENNSLPDDVLQIVREHHENCLGLGFPNRLNKSNIHPMARLISVADEFCGRILPGPDSPQMMPKEALNSMLMNYDGRLDLQFLNALRSIFESTD